MAVDYIRIIRDDMDLFHDGPSGVLETLNSWGSGAFPPEYTQQPSGWSAYVMWGHMMRDATEAAGTLTTTDRNRPWRVSRTRQGNNAPNTRIQVRHHQILWLLSNGEWYIGESRDNAQPILYPFNWNEGTEITMPTPNYRAMEPLGGSSMRAVSLANDPQNPTSPNQYRDRIWHNYANRQTIPANYVGWVTGFFARLILDNPALADDRANCNILAGCAFDWYQAMTLSQPPAAGVNVTYGGYSRLKYLSSDWQLIAHTSLTEAQLRANPPPMTGLGLLETTSPPSSIVPPVPTFNKGRWFTRLTAGKSTWLSKNPADSALTASPISLSVGLAGTLTNHIRMVGSVNGALTTTSALRVSPRFAGSLAVSGAATGSLFNRIQMTGATNASVTADSSLRLSVRFVGSTSGRANLEAGFSPLIRFIGSSSASVTNTAQIQVSPRFAGSIQANLVSSANISAGARMASSIVIFNAVSAQLNTGIRLNGISAAAVNTIAQIFTRTFFRGGSNLRVQLFSNELSNYLRQAQITEEIQMSTFVIEILASAYVTEPFTETSTVKI